MQLWDKMRSPALPTQPSLPTPTLPTPLPAHPAHLSLTRGKLFWLLHPLCPRLRKDHPGPLGTHSLRASVLATSDPALDMTRVSYLVPLPSDPPHPQFLSASPALVSLFPLSFCLICSHSLSLSPLLPSLPPNSLLNLVQRELVRVMNWFCFLFSGFFFFLNPNHKLLIEIFHLISFKLIFKTKKK